MYKRKQQIPIVLKPTESETKVQKAVIERNVKCSECGGSVTAIFEPKRKVVCNECGKEL